MKRISILNWLFAWVLMACFSACSDEKMTNPILGLGEQEVTFEAMGGEQQVQLVCDGEWTISEIPEWVSVGSYSGNGSKVLTIMATDNESLEAREATLNIVSRGLYTSLKIVQDRANKLSLLDTYFTLFQSSNVKPKDNGAYQFVFDAHSMFINPAIRNKIFLGNLLNANAQSNDAIIDYRGYTYLPITVSTNLPDIFSFSFTPSKENYDSMVQTILKKAGLNTQLSMAAVSGDLYTSHRQLYLSGMAEMGIRLDSLVSGKSYREKEMTKKTGLLYSYVLSLCTFDMDIPEKLLQEDLQIQDFSHAKLSYISSVSYGRAALLLVESDADADQLRGLVKKIGNKTLLSSEETMIVASMNAYYCYFDATGQLLKREGKQDVIQAYFDEASKQAVIPLRFSVSDYFTHGSSSIEFPLYLP